MLPCGPAGGPLLGLGVPWLWLPVGRREVTPPFRHPRQPLLQRSSPLARPLLCSFCGPTEAALRAPLGAAALWAPRASGSGGCVPLGHRRRRAAPAEGAGPTAAACCRGPGLAVDLQWAAMWGGPILGRARGEGAGQYTSAQAPWRLWGGGGALTVKERGCTAPGWRAKSSVGRPALLGGGGVAPAQGTSCQARCYTVRVRKGMEVPEVWAMSVHGRVALGRGPNSPHPSPLGWGDEAFLMFFGGGGGFNEGRGSCSVRGRYTRGPLMALAGSRPSAAKARQRPPGLYRLWRRGGLREDKASGL